MDLFKNPQWEVQPQNLTKQKGLQECEPVKYEICMPQILTKSYCHSYLWMCCTRFKAKTFCLEVLTRVLAWVGKQLHAALDKLNNTWYRFLLYCFTEISRWPNKTMGELLPVTYVGLPIDKNTLKQETWV